MQSQKKIVTKAIEYLGIKVSNYNNVITSLSGGINKKSSSQNL